MAQMQVFSFILISFFLLISSTSRLFSACYTQKTGYLNHNFSVKYPESYASIAPQAEKVNITLIFTGDFQVDGKLAQLLEGISWILDEEMSLKLGFSVGKWMEMSDFKRKVVKSQLCAYEKSVKLGSFRVFLDILSAWLSTGTFPTSNPGFSDCFNQSEYVLSLKIDDFTTSEYTGPGLLLSGHYFPAFLSQKSLVSVLCAMHSSSLSGRQLAEECSPGCTSALYLSRECVPACNTPACAYQNWTCDCAPGCSYPQLTNMQCDSQCNTANCLHDNYYCPDTILPGNYSSYDPQSPNSTEPEWSKWIIIVLSLIAFA